jgi:PKHD-type hydroxylase
MSYRLLPSPNFGRGEHPFTSWNDLFSPEEIAKIVEIGESFLPTEAQIGSGIDTDYRRSKTSWIQLNSDTEWIFSRIGHMVSSLNGQFYGFDLYGFAESLQYTVYSEEDEGCYDWHRDLGSQTAPRKLSAVVQLSDPDDYEGGDLELMTSKTPDVVDRCAGRGVVFPSFVLHRVTPVTKGVRKTLVAWACGNQFK